MSFPPETNILVIDDMMTMRKLVSNSLKDLGYTKTSEAVDGEDGWRKLEQAPVPIDLIISDWNMPTMTGLELLKKCKADARFKGVPFIMLTAEAEQHQVMAAVKEGAQNYIIKPFTGPILKEKLAQAYAKVKKA